MRRVKKLLVVCVLGLSFQAAGAASLYKESAYQSLTADHKAYREGDLITILVYENSSASSSANTTAGRDANVGVDVQGIGSGTNAGIKFNNQHDGRGQTLREGRVLAQITVAVQGVTTNGDLLVAGEQSVEINNEQQQIKVEGKVRRKDISEANTVLSTRLADAKISYVGYGDLADRQRPGWWARLLNWFGL